MADYLLGLATLPALALAGWALFWAWIWCLETLLRFGVTVECKSRRRMNDYDLYTVRNDIVWEQQRGPIFTGHWYRDNVLAHAATRWVGVGSKDGPCLIVFHKRTFPKKGADRG